MKPCSASVVQAGDWVVVDGWLGEVVFCSLSDSYASDYSKSEWPLDEYQGIMIRQVGGALVFYELYWFEASDPISLEWAIDRPLSK